MKVPPRVARVGRHFANAWKRYRSEGGDRLAAAVSYYGFLSFFPLILLALSVVGFVVKGSASAQQRVLDALDNFLPHALVSDPKTGIDLNAVAAHRSQIGLIALAGLLISGTGWIGSLRESLRRMWGKEDIQRNFFISKLLDVGLLAALGIVLGVSIGVSGIASQTTGTLLQWFGLEQTNGARHLVKVIGLVLPFIVDMAIFGYFFSLLPQVRTPAGSLIRGAFLGAVAFELLKIGGAYYVARTTKSGTAIYGTAAVIVGLVVWLNLVSRVTLFVGAWTAVSAEAASAGSALRDVDVAGAT